MKILVCEDETPALRQILKHIKAVRRDIEVVATAETGEEAIAAIGKYDLDLIFMDIELADGPCFETIGKIDINIPVIFTTAYDEYALKAFEMKSVDYLVKPITKKDIEKSFEKLGEMKRIFERDSEVYFQKGEGSIQLEGRKKVFDKLETFLEDRQKSTEVIERLFIKNGETINIVRTADIQWIEASGNYITIVTEQKKYLLRSTLGGIIGKLNPNIFSQIHKSTILNIDFIEKIEEMAYGDYKIILKNQKTLKMSRNYKELIQPV